MCLSVPYEGTFYAIRKSDLGLDSVFTFSLVVNTDLTVRMRHCAADLLDVTQVWLDHHLAESRSSAVDAEDSAEELDVRA